MKKLSLPFSSEVSLLNILLLGSACWEIIVFSRWKSFFLTVFWNFVEWSNIMWNRSHSVWFGILAFMRKSKLLFSIFFLMKTYYFHYLWRVTWRMFQGVCNYHNAIISRSFGKIICYIFFSRWFCMKPLLTMVSMSFFKLICYFDLAFLSILHFFYLFLYVL